MEITRPTSEPTGIQKTARTLVVAFMAAEAQLGLVAKDLKLRDRVEQIMRAAQHSDLSEDLYRIVYTICSLLQRRSTDDDHQIARTCPHNNAKFRDYAMYDARQSAQQLFQAVDVYLTEIKFAAAKRQKANERTILHD